MGLKPTKFIQEYENQSKIVSQQAKKVLTPDNIMNLTPQQIIELNRKARRGTFTDTHWKDVKANMKQNQHKYTITKIFGGYFKFQLDKILMVQKYRARAKFFYQVQAILSRCQDKIKSNQQSINEITKHHLKVVRAWLLQQVFKAQAFVTLGIFIPGVVWMTKSRVNSIVVKLLPLSLLFIFGSKLNAIASHYNLSWNKKKFINKLTEVSYYQQSGGEDSQIANEMNSFLSENKELIELV